MSNSLAIAAVTLTLKNILIAGCADVTDLGVIKFTTQPPDKARTSDNDNQVNVFLYNAVINGAWRNNPEIPGKTRPGESAVPPLALDLWFLISTYGQGNDAPDPNSHRLLGKAMSNFHDHPVLSAAEISAALNDSELEDQIERVRIVPVSLTADEISKWWSAFQTNYRTSAAYQVSVVLIESTRPKRTPLPVLTVGLNDRGVFVQPDLTPPFPTIAALALPPRRSSVELGDLLTLKGFHLSGTTVEVRFAHPLLSTPNLRAPEAGSTDTDLKVKIPDVIDDASAPANWPPGFYRVSVAVTNGTKTRVTNEQAFALAPRIEARSPASSPIGSFTLNVDCRPQVRPTQSVVLLLNDRVIAAQPFAIPGSASAPTALSFQINGATPNLYTLRLRIDGVDSAPIDYAGVPPLPFFDPNQQVTVT